MKSIAPDLKFYKKTDGQLLYMPRLSRRNRRSTLKVRNQSIEPQFSREISSITSRAISLNQWQAISERGDSTALSRRFLGQSIMAKCKDNSELDVTRTMEDSFLPHLHNDQKERKIYQEKRRYRDESISKTKQIQKLVKEKQQVAINHAKLIISHQKLVYEKKDFQEKIQYLEAELSRRGVKIAKLKQQLLGHSHSYHHHTEESCTSIHNTKSRDSCNEPSNPLNKLKSIKRFGKEKDSLPTQISCSFIKWENNAEKIAATSKAIMEHQQQAAIFHSFNRKEQPSHFLKTYEKERQELQRQKNQIEERYDFVQKQYFQARQEIKRLSLEIGCAKKRVVEEYEFEKKVKNSEYAQLKSKFICLLNENTQLIKKQKKQEITEKIRKKLIPSKELTSSVNTSFNRTFLSAGQGSMDDLTLSHFSLSSDDSRII